MKPALILLAILVVGGAIVWLIDRLFYRHDDDPGTNEASDDDLREASASGCVDEPAAYARFAPASRFSRANASRKSPTMRTRNWTRFAGLGENDYSPDEEEQWRDVLYTLQPGDLLGWGQSIKHRGLIMPASIHDEFLQLAAEVRF